MRVDKAYCSSLYLMYRSLLDKNNVFYSNSISRIARLDFGREKIQNSDDLLEHLKNEILKATANNDAALMLSGGIDSAILAHFMPRNSKTYTFKCNVPGREVTDETKIAKVIAEDNGLQNEVINIYWNDFKQYAPILMQHKGAPVHSIEIQIYKAALKAKKDGINKVIFGENADIIYGGMNGLLAKDWLFGEFVERYTYVQPYKVLKEYIYDLSPFEKYCKDGHIDGHDFINEFFRLEALGSYQNACECAGVEFIGPYSTSKLDCKLDYNRIRSGDTKYLVREVFKKIYGDKNLPPKIPMPRPMNEWLENWSGPTRKEFWPHCADNMTGDQKWMVYCLELFYNIMENSNDKKH